MAIVKKYSAEVVSIESKIKDIYTIELSSLGKPFKYAPGQFLHLSLDEYDPSMQWPESRCFSMQSSPAEELIRITYAVKGIFTSRMRDELEVGKLVTLKMPYGDLFIQLHSKANTVFIAGGTGITPFLSLFTDNSFRLYTNPTIYLGFRSKYYNIYQKELSGLRSQQIKTFYEDLNGIISIDTIINDNTSPESFFISGPPTMISFFRDALVKRGIEQGIIYTDAWE